MKAITYKEYGSPEVLQISEIEKPVPKENELLIKIHATSVNYGDIIARNFKAITPQKFNMPFPFWMLAKLYFGLKKPKINILGSEYSGEIELTGKDVKEYKHGDQVFGYLGQSMGAYAEYICIPENAVLALKPANITFEEAAIVPYGSIMAFHLLKKMKIKSGQKILINGASGGIGSAAVQIAKYFGAEVTGVCGTPRLEYVRALGADKVIDYTKEDISKSAETFDLIVDILGKGSFLRHKRNLSQNGRVLFVSFKMKQLFQMLWTSMFGNKKAICALAPGSRADLLSVKELIEAGRIKAILDKYFTMEQIAEAHQYVETGRKTGNVVIVLK